MNDPKIIVALDFSDEEKALSFVDQLAPSQCRLKVGKALFTRSGPAFIKKLIDKGFDIFLDLKFHDIPHQVALACRAAAELGVWMIDVHALGGKKMLQAAREGIENALASNPTSRRPLLIAVTILTSLDESELPDVGLEANVGRHVERLAQLTKEAGLDGVVCSGHEAALLRKKLGPDFVLVTPGIRLHQNPKDDQQRVVTVSEALHMGSTYLVVGRPITQAKNPLSVINEMEQMISSAQNNS